MPDITQAYAFDSEDLKAIQLKKSQNSFSYKSWEDEGLSKTKSKIRKYYRLIQDYRCAYCREYISNLSPLNCQIEHIIPKSKHVEFLFEPVNLCVVCADCNTYKNNTRIYGEIPEMLNSKGRKIKKYPNKSEYFEIIHPHFDNYKDHILIMYGAYISISQKGAFTILVCQLNKKIYKETGWEPIMNNDRLSELFNLYLSVGENSLLKEMIEREIGREIFTTRKD